MKCLLTITGISVLLVALTAPFLVGAGNTTVYAGDAYQAYEPEPRDDDVTLENGQATVKPYNPTGGGIMAVVKDVSGNDTTVYFGELADGDERYLMVVCGNCDSTIRIEGNDTITIVDTFYLTLCPGPGTYDIKRYIPYGDSVDSITKSSLNTDSLGQVFDTVWTMTPGGVAIYYFEPADSIDTFDVTLGYHKATYASNARKIGVDDYGSVHICFTDSLSGDNAPSVWYARSDDCCSTWQKQKVADNAFVPTIAVDNFTVPWITYLTYPDMDTICVWSEGYYDTLACDIDGSGCDEVSAPAIALDFNLGLGVIYHNLNALRETSLSVIELPSRQVINRKDYSCQLGYPSCVITPEGFGLAAGNRTYNKGLSWTLEQRLDRKLNEPGIIGSYQYIVSGEYQDPHMTRQGGRVWVVYTDPTNSDKGIYYKATSYEEYPENEYMFPLGDGTLIKNTPGDCARYVQLAEHHPFVVWEDHDTEHGIKIYYCYMQSNGEWTNPARVSNNPDSITERYPHVAIDEASKKAHVIWTQWGTDSSSIGGGTITLPDSVRVVSPNGDEKFNMYTWFTSKISETAFKIYKIDNLIPVYWSQTEKDGQPGITKVYVTYDYNSESTDWGEPVATSSIEDGNKKYYKGLTCREIYFKPARSTDEARVKVEAFYNEVTVFDISDGNFEIIANQGPGWQEAEAGMGPGIFSVGNTPATQERKQKKKGIVATFNEWHETSSSNPGETPSLLVYMPDDTVEEIGWYAAHYSGFSKLNLLYSYDDGETYTVEDSATADTSFIIDTTYTADDDTLVYYCYAGTVTWDVPEDPVYGSYLQLMSIDTTSDTFYSDPLGPFMIAPPGSNANCTRLDQRLIGAGTAAGKIGIAYQAKETDTSASIIRYMESDEGLGFNAPESLGTGVYPAMAEGAVVWVSENSDSVFGTGWTGSEFDGASCYGGPKPYAITTKYFPPAIIVDDYDTARAVTLSKAVYQTPVGYKTYFFLDYMKFPKDEPDSTYSNFYPIDTIFGIDTASSAAISITNIGNDLYVGFSIRDTIYYIPGTTTGFMANNLDTIGPGFSPQVSAYEGNVILSYMKPDSSAIIRLWGYRDDTAWVEKDTIDLSEHGTCMTETKGALYSIQQADTTADQFVYDPISEELYLERSYDGFYAHPWLDDTDSTFSRVDCYTWEYDSSSYALRTNRKPLNVINPAVYVEADDYRSPYCDFRDTCIHYASVDVDSGADSLVYVCPALNSGEKYAVIVEFYTECETATQLEIEVGANLDTIQIAPESYSWYEQNVAAGTDTLELTIRKLSRDGFVPVSRVIVRRRSDSGIFMMGSPGEDKMPIEIPFCLYQPFPNPFGNAATIRYSLPYATHVSLKVYDVSGRMVNKLVDEEVAPGIHTLQWTGKDDLNRKCASGVYFVRFAADDYTASKKMVLVK